MTAELPRPGELYCPTCEQTFVTGERCPDDDTKLVRLNPKRDDLIGRDLDGRYTILERIGQGGMGTVYRANQRSIGRDVAVKVVMPRLITDDTVIKRFLREAKLASRLSHPNAVSVLDFGQTDDGLFFLVMELVLGRTLEAVFADDGALAPDRVARIGMQICDALEGAHALHIIHRDLKPANVMLLSTGRDLVKVLDFGLAKSLTREAGLTTMTNEGAVLGTPAFMPPEAVGDGQLDARSDLYSLGCLLYTAAAGKQPFAGTSLHELIAKHLTESPAPIEGLPPDLWAVLARLLAKTPDQRYATARDTRDALEACLAHTSAIAAAPAPPTAQLEAPAKRAQFATAETVAIPDKHELVEPARPPPAAKRRPWPLLVGAGLVIVSLGTVAGYALFSGGKHHDARAKKPPVHETTTGKGESKPADEPNVRASAAANDASPGSASTTDAAPPPPDATPPTESTTDPLAPDPHAEPPPRRAPAPRATPAPDRPEL